MASELCGPVLQNESEAIKKTQRRYGLVYVEVSRTHFDMILESVLCFYRENCFGPVEVGEFEWRMVIHRHCSLY